MSLLCFIIKNPALLKQAFTSSSKQETKQTAAEALLNYITGTEISSENVVRGKGLLKLIMSKYFQVENVA